MNTNQRYVISLGGSLINPTGEPDVHFLKKFIGLIRSGARRGDQFIIITGGGKLCRQFQAALKNVAATTSADLDWLGIHTTRYHAEFVRLCFGALAHPSIVTDPGKRVAGWKRPVLLAGGYKPGRSTDYVAVALAKTYGIHTVINLSNVDYVYTKDPRTFKDAEKIESASWKTFLKITGTRWVPGKNVPFDPTAAKFAAAHKLRVIIAGGKDMKNLRTILSGNKKFHGTTVA